MENNGSNVFFGKNDTILWICDYFAIQIEDNSLSDIHCLLTALNSRQFFVCKIIFEVIKSWLYRHKKVEK